MFDMVRTGSRISELRKARNMTQMELADQMNISFQAVSNWERGVSMPDITKLPELADLFGVTIDDLLGEKSELLQSVLDDEGADYLQNNAITTSEFKAIAPLLKPAQADEIIAKVKPSVPLSEMVDILPFVSSRVVSQLALKHSDNSDYEGLGGLAPFMEQEALATIARKMLSEQVSIAPIAPFLDETTLARFLVDKYPWD